MEEIYPYELFEKFLAPFSGHMLEFKGVLYTTVEHAYHCQRYTDTKVMEEIKQARSAYLAWETSQKYKNSQVADFDVKKVEIMEELFKAKISQHADVKEALMQSGDTTIVKHQADKFWGDGIDGAGRNEMGKVWMKLRTELK